MNTENKVLPHDIDAEMALISAMFINNKIIHLVKMSIDFRDFYRDSHVHICKAIFSLGNTDMTLIKDSLKKSGDFEKCGGELYLMTFLEFASTSASYKHYCDIVKELSDRRKLILKCQETINKSSDLTEAFENTILSHNSNISSIIIENKKDDYRNNLDIVTEIMKDIEDRRDSGKKFAGIETGFTGIDQNMYGLEPKTTTYLIARPSIGKTCLALNIAGYVAENYSHKVLFISLESGDSALMRRRLAAKSGVYLSSLRTGNFGGVQWEDYLKSADALGQHRGLIIIGNPKFKVIENLVMMTESMAIQYPISLIVIDHIQRMRSIRKIQSRHLELSHVSEELSSLSINLNVPILILCQLSRRLEERPKNKQHPRLVDMKESGDLEANADNVLGLYRENKEAEMAELECLKGRDTGTWKAWLRFDRYIQKFYDADNNG